MPERASDKTKEILKKISDIAARVERLEGTASGYPGGAPRAADHAGHFCAMPEVPERQFEATVSSDRARLIRYIGKKWVNGTKLRYYFFPSGPWSGGREQLDLVREGFEVWSDVGIGLAFEEVTNIEDAEIRIGFLQGDGAWSYVGRDVIDIPGQRERTMNFGWDLTGDPRGVDTPVHEIGHTLGFPHEHQNPFSGIVWDEEAVYRYFAGSPNFWSRQQTFHNVLRKLSQSEVEGSSWDPNSVMHYGFRSGLILEPAEHRGGITPELGLSDSDVDEVRRLYPPLDDQDYDVLRPFRSEQLSLNPAEQKDFWVEPSDTRSYTLQTFGSSDVVMVLFEEQGGELRYVAGDDDSGLDFNARIRTRLRRGVRYVLRIRLYLNYASGDTAVMMW